MPEPLHEPVMPFDNSVFICVPLLRSVQIFLFKQSIPLTPPLIKVKGEGRRGKGFLRKKYKKRRMI